MPSNYSIGNLTHSQSFDVAANEPLSPLTTANHIHYQPSNVAFDGSNFQPLLPPGATSLTNTQSSNAIVDTLNFQPLLAPILSETQMPSNYPSAMV